MRLVATTLLLSALSFGCSTSPYMPVRMPASAPAEPPGVAHGDGVFQGARGTKLYEQWWKPEAKKPRAVFVVVHGLKDHSSRYAELAARLVEKGVAVEGFDLRGHGRSEGQRVDVRSFDDYLVDVGAFIDRAKWREPNVPVFLFGHSMGGAIVTLYTITRKPDLAGLVTSGAAIQTDVGTVKRGGTRFVEFFQSDAPFFNLDLDDFSRDAAVVKACKEDPLVYQDGAPVHTATELLDAMGTIHDRMGEIAVPLLILHGDADKVTLPAGSSELKERAGSKDKTLHLYPGYYHDILHEPEKVKVQDDIIAWIEGHVAK